MLYAGCLDHACVMAGDVQGNCNRNCNSCGAAFCELGGYLTGLGHLNHCLDDVTSWPAEYFAGTLSRIFCSPRIWRIVVKFADRS